MKTVNIYEAKTNLSKLLEMVQNGEEVVIAKAGKPIADLRPYQERKKVVKYGVGAKSFSQHNDKLFDGVDSDIQEMFYGKDWDK